MEGRKVLETMEERKKLEELEMVYRTMKRDTGHWTLDTGRSGMHSLSSICISQPTWAVSRSEAESRKPCTSYPVQRSFQFIDDAWCIDGALTVRACSQRGVSIMSIRCHLEYSTRHGATVG